MVQRPGRLLFTACLCALAFVGAAGTASAATKAGTIAQFSTPGGVPAQSIVGGPDGNVWFTMPTAGAIGRATTTGKVTRFTRGLSPGADPSGITLGPDGNLWFTEPAANRIGRITPAGGITEFSAGLSAGAGPQGIATGPDGNLWFTEQNGNRLGRITTTGTITEFGTGITPGSGPNQIALGPDGNLWFTETSGDRIGRITPAGGITEFTAGITPPAAPLDLVPGSDGALWFTESGAGRLAHSTTAGLITELPDAFAQPSGITRGPDGDLWVAGTGGTLARVTTAGAVTHFGQGLASGSTPYDIAPGPDGNLWFTELGQGRFGRVTSGVAPGPVGPGGLTVAIAATHLRVPQRGTLKVPYLTTSGAALMLVATKTHNTKTTPVRLALQIARTSGRGMLTVKLPKKLVAARYTLELTATTALGTVVDDVLLTVTT